MNSKVGSFLRFMTRKKINHVSLRLDEGPQVSFRRENPKNFLTGRYGTEDLNTMVGGRPSYIERITLTLSDEEAERVRRAMSSQEGHLYNFVSCFLLWFGTGTQSTEK